MKTSRLLPETEFIRSNKEPRKPSSLRASALLIVLWGVTMMSVTVLGMVEYVHYDLEETIALEKNFRTRQLAEAGLAIGLHPMMKKGDGLLSQTIGPGESFEVHLHSEGGRLNINTIIQGAQWQILHDLFVAWRLKESDAANVADAFRIWTQTDKWQELSPSQNGTAGLAVAGQPGVQLLPHQFQTVEEMQLIPGMDMVAGAKPDWKDYFTIWSDGLLDMNEAPAQLIVAVCGIGQVQAERFVNMRLGPDGKPDTDDDVIFQSMEQVQQLLGMPGGEFAKIQSRLSLQDSATRVESTGIVGSYRRKIMVIARRATAPPAYLLWQEQ